MLDLESVMLSVTLLIIISVILAKVTNNTGFPYLLLFLIVGMLAGSEGIGGIYFDNSQLAQNIGVVALVLILFSGGLDTNWSIVKSSTPAAVTLATIGVLATALLLGGFVYFILDISLLQAFLLGSVVASTDAAAVFSILGGRSLNLKGKVKSLLELESGSNDPMAIFLTIGFIQLITAPETTVLDLLLLFTLQMALGFAFGFLGGKSLTWLINKIKFPVEGFYAVMILAFVFFVYSGTTLLNGSGFLAVYVLGIVVNTKRIVFKRSVSRFFDGFAWLGQIVMFITLGLLVFPSQLLEIAPYGLLVSLFLIFIARPLGVFMGLIPFKYNFKEKLFISWVGLRGAVPIILATFPLLAEVPEAGTIFNIVFFIVLTSALFQGWTIPFAANKLKLLDIEEDKSSSPIEFTEGQEADMSIIKILVPENPDVIDKPLVELPPLKGSLIILLVRDGQYIVPSGGTTLQAGDRLQVLTKEESVESIRAFFR